MTTLVLYTSMARQDALDILEHLSNEAGKAAAIAFAQKFEGIFDRIAAYPEVYPLRPSLGARIRIAAVWPYVVLYRYDQPRGTATILRLLHGRRDITADFMKRR